MSNANDYRDLLGLLPSQPIKVPVEMAAQIHAAGPIEAFGRRWDVIVRELGQGMAQVRAREAA